jgi:hypothetical protein
MKESVLHLIELCKTCGTAYAPDLGDYHECKEESYTNHAENSDPRYFKRSSPADGWLDGEYTL